jgi:hypothetical protein
LEKLVGKEVKAGEYVDVTVQFTAPDKVGKYCGFYRFVHGKNERFGQKVWCDVIVKEGDSE